MTTPDVQNHYDSLSDEQKMCIRKGCKNIRSPEMCWHMFLRCEMDNCPNLKGE